MLDILRDRLQGGPVLLMGVGNRLRGDDAFGDLLIDRLRGKSSLMMLDVEDVPENYLGEIERAAPRLVLVADAVDFGGNPGDISLLELQQLSARAVYTHHSALGLLFRAIALAPPPEVLILAVQPGQLELGAPLSAPVEMTLDALANWFLTL